MELAAEAAELAQAEIATIALLERVRARAGQSIQLRTRTGQQVAGVLKEVSEQYLLIDEGGGLEALVPVTAVALIGPLAGAAAPEGEVRIRPTIGRVLREMASQGIRVRVIAGGVDTVGKIVRVGVDHVDVLPDGAGSGAARVSVLFSGIELIRSR